MKAQDTILSDDDLIDVAETLYNFRNAMDIKGIKNILWQLCNRQAKQSLSMIEGETRIRKNSPLDKVARWPKWKRQIKVTKYSKGI